MKTGVRLGLFGIGLLTAFGGAFVIAGAVVPGGAVAAWTTETEMAPHLETHDPAAAASTVVALRGLALSTDGYVLSPVAAPSAVGEAGTLSFQIQNPLGEPVLHYTTAHDKDMHLIVVRADGTDFRHVHPVLDLTSGTWTIPWTWHAGGTYRVYTDFTTSGAEPTAITLTRAVHVPGEFTPVARSLSQSSQVNGFDVTVDGALTAGSSSELEISISRDGVPVTGLEPYLGAFGHLVALREGDLAFLHVHAEGDDPEIGDTAGPAIAFFAEAPTSGRYLLYLNFQVEGEVHTAEFVLDASTSDGSANNGASHSDDGGH